MKYTSFTKSFVLTTLFLGASVSMGAQSLTELQAKPMSSNAILKQLQEPVFVNTVAQSAEAANGGCFDMTKVGSPDIIRCFTKQLESSIVGEQKVKYNWSDAVRDDSHPYQTLMSSPAKDDLVADLDVLPPGGSHSIRISSNAYQQGDMAKASMTAFFQNISADHPIILMSYAAVLEKTNHTIAKTGFYDEYAQPWIHIYVIDLNHAANEDSYLACPDIIIKPYTQPATVTGPKWSTYTNGSRVFHWQDWDTIQLDMTKYIGHRLVFIYEIYDCAIESGNASYLDIVLCEKNEKCRLYVSMDCASSEIQHDCAGKGTNLTAPDGFKTYKWFATSAPSRTLGTAQTLYVEPTTTTEYTCQITSDCGTTTLKTTVTPNIFDLGTVELCNGKSFVLGDTTLRTNGTYTRTIPRRGKCDSIATVTMAFGDGDRYTLSDVYIKEGESVRVGDSIFRTEGPHTSIIKRNDNCDSIVTLNIYFNDPVPTPEGCIDFTQLGNPDVIRCINHDIKKKVVNPDREIYSYGWSNLADPPENQVMTPTNHPRQRLMTTQKNDENVPSLKVLPSGAQYSVRCGSEGYGTDDTLGKGAVTAFYLKIDKTNAIVSMNSAIILEKSNHDIIAYPVYKDYAQPYISMYVYNITDNQTIWQEDFYPASNPASVTGGKWKEYSNGSHSYHWRDWDTQRFDLSQYIGKEMYFIYMTHDCAISNGAPDGMNDIVPCKEHEIARVYAHIDCEGLVSECIGTAKMKQDTVCADAQNLAIAVKFTEGTPSSYDLRFSDAAKAAGFKDVTGASLSLDGEGNAEIAIDLEAANPTTDGTPWYKRPGTYQVTVVEHGECDNDPQQTLSFTLLYPSSIITQRWNDVLALNNDKYNGGYVFSRIRWFHAGEGEIQGSGSHNSYVYRTLVPDDAYWAELTRSSDGQTICTCRKIAVHQDEATAFEDGQLVHIRRFNAPQEVEIATEISGHYYMYDALGRLIATGTFGHEYGNMTIDLSDIHSNMVIITFHGNEGTKETKKLIAF